MDELRQLYFTDNYVMLTVCTVYVAMCMFELQEPRLTPSVVATAEELADIFSGDSHVQLKTSADVVKISQPTNLFDGICSVMAVFWVFDIAFQCSHVTVCMADMLIMFVDKQNVAVC